jgi:hypothetical protein
MENNQNSYPNALDVWAWRDLSRKKAELAGFAKNSPEDDAFRHIYTNAMITWLYGLPSGFVFTEGLGNIYEGLEMGKFLIIDMVQSAAELFGYDVESKDRVDFGAHALDGIMDVTNNQIGLMIGSQASSEEDIIQKVTTAIKSGTVVLDPQRIPEILKEKKSFVEGDGMWESPSRAGGIDTGSLIRALSGGKKSGMSSKQIFAMSAAAFAQELIKSRRRSLENDLLELLTGGNGKNTLAQTGSGNPMASLPNVFGGLIDNLVGSAMSRQKTRVSSTESDRSREAQKNWNLSRSQQQAMLAGWAQQGNRNL